MKYAITGHTYGIGEGLYKRLSPNAIGFSKSTGYDITKKEIRKKIIEEVHDCDVFINNAPAGFGQSELCLELWQAWKHTNKTIINVGSRIAEGDIVYQYPGVMIEYGMHKKTLKTLTEDLQKIDAPINVVYRWFAYVGTPTILSKYPDFTTDDYITIDEAVDIILS